MDCSPPGSSAHGILQARILESVAIPISRGSSQPRGRTRVSFPAGGLLTHWATREAQNSLGWHQISFILGLSHWWHHWLNGHEFEQTPGNSEGPGSLACLLQSVGSQRGRHNLAKMTNLSHSGFCPRHIIKTIFLKTTSYLLVCKSIVILQSLNNITTAVLKLLWGLFFLIRLLVIR